MQDNLDMQTENRKRKIRKSAVAFFTVMLILAFFSRTINHFSLPRVQYERPSRGSIVRDTRMDGTVDANEIYHCYVPSGMKVLDTHAKAGEIVKKGQILLSLDTETIKKQLLDATDRYEQKKINLAMLQLASDSFQLYEYENAIDSARIQLEHAQSDYDRVRALYEAKCETAEKHENALRKMNEAQRAYQKAVSDKENAILSHRIEYEKNQLEIQSLQYETKIQQREMERMKEQLLLGELTAPFDGIITDIHLRKGETTDQSQSVYSMIDASKGYCFTGLMDIDDAADLKPGDEAEISLDALQWKKIKGRVAEIGKPRKEQDRKEVVIDITDDVLAEGQKEKPAF